MFYLKAFSQSVFVELARLDEKRIGKDLLSLIETSLEDTDCDAYFKFVRLILNLDDYEKYESFFKSIKGTLIEFSKTIKTRTDEATIRMIMIELEMENFERMILLLIALFRFEDESSIKNIDVYLNQLDEKRRYMQKWPFENSNTGLDMRSNYTLIKSNDQNRERKSKLVEMNVDTASENQSIYDKYLDDLIQQNDEKQTSRNYNLLHSSSRQEIKDVQNENEFKCNNKYLLTLEEKEYFDVVTTTTTTMMNKSEKDDFYQKLSDIIPFYKAFIVDDNQMPIAEPKNDNDDDDAKCASMPAISTATKTTTTTTTTTETTSTSAVNTTTNANCLIDVAGSSMSWPNAFYNFNYDYDNEL